MRAVLRGLGFEGADAIADAWADQCARLKDAAVSDAYGLECGARDISARLLWGRMPLHGRCGFLVRRSSAEGAAGRDVRQQAPQRGAPPSKPPPSRPEPAAASTPLLVESATRVVRPLLGAVEDRWCVTIEVPRPEAYHSLAS